MGTQTAAPTTNRSTSTHPVASRAHVLLIGNMHRVGDALRRACAPGDSHLSLEADAQAGLIQAARGRHDLIVVDLLFLARGVALCHDLRAGGVRAPILLLAVTGSGAEVIAGLDAGADDCIAGSVADEEVRARATGLLRRRGPREPLRSAGEQLRAGGNTEVGGNGRGTALGSSADGRRCRA